MTVSVSVVIPAFDEELGIVASVRAVRAALDGTDTEYELLVIDDGSRDRTADLASFFLCF